MEFCNTGILGLREASHYNEVMLLTVIPLFPIGGMNQVSLKAICFHYVVEITE